MCLQVGRGEFQVAVSILDMVYGQGLVWWGLILGFLLSCFKGRPKLWLLGLISTSRWKHHWEDTTQRINVVSRALPGEKIAILPFLQKFLTEDVRLSVSTSESRKNNSLVNIQESISSAVSYAWSLTILNFCKDGCVCLFSFFTPVRIGTFFSPILPAFAMAKTLLLFFYYYYTTMFAHAAPKKIFRASRSGNFLLFVLQIDLLLCLLPILYVLSR